jgi:Legionella pneumophila major outer membrane protein precursor
MVALAESTFFWPSFSGVAVSNGIGAAGAAGPITNIGSNANSLFLVAPRITLGVQGNQWGVVGRFWYAQSTTTNAIDVEPNGVNSQNSFQAYTADLEVVRRFAGRQGSIWAFGGFRYAALNYQQSFAAGTFTTTDFVQSSAFGNSRFNGAGFTFGAYGTHAIGNSPFSLFASNRYSFLFGSGRSVTQAEASVLTPGGSDAAADCTCGGDRAAMFIAEVQLGAQWEHQLRWMPARAFVRTAAEYQYWTTGGITDRSITQTAVFGNTVGTGTASAGNLLLNMVGFNIGAGIIY